MFRAASLEMVMCGQQVVEAKTAHPLTSPTHKPLKSYIDQLTLLITLFWLVKTVRHRKRGC